MSIACFDFVYRFNIPLPPECYESKFYQELYFGNFFTQGVAWDSGSCLPETKRKIE